VSLLEVRNLCKEFGGVKALEGVSFDVEAGQLVALLGPNGAGKSTCFNVINGQLRPDSGSVHFAGQSLSGMHPRRIWRLGVGRTFQVAATFGSLSVLENVQLAIVSREHKLYGLAGSAAVLYRDEAGALLDQVGMQQHASRTCGELAYGDVKRVELAMALANRPKLLLMDEPTAGMAPAERHDLMALVKKLVVEHNLGVLFTEHSMDVVFAYADQMVVLARGQLIASGPGDAIRDHPKVREVYFGTAVRGEQSVKTAAT
jgi:branched-chain amino acid transport system ATP-binding protein